MWDPPFLVLFVPTMWATRKRVVTHWLEFMHALPTKGFTLDWMVRLVLLECVWVLHFVVVCSNYAEPKKKIQDFLGFQHLITLPIIKHYQYEMLIQ